MKQYLATCISMTRVIFGPLLPVLYRRYQQSMQQFSILHICLMLAPFILGLTDFIDGKVARALGSVGPGHLIDSGADRFLIIPLLYMCLYMAPQIPYRYLFIYAAFQEVCDVFMLACNMIPIQYHDFFGHMVHFTKYTFFICQFTISISFMLIMLTGTKYMSYIHNALWIAYTLKLMSLAYYFMRHFVAG